MRSMSPGERRPGHPEAIAEQPTASLQTIQPDVRASWAPMTAVHDALRRDLDQLTHSTASRAVTRARWIVFRDQLAFHFAAEHAAMWPPVRARLTGDPHGQALLDAMDDEYRLLGALQVMIDDAFAMDAEPRRLRQLLVGLRTRLASHLAREEAEVLPLISGFLFPGELGGIAAAIRGGRSTRCAGTTVPWALAGAVPDIRERILSQLPAPARVLYRTVWLLRYARTIPSL